MAGTGAVYNEPLPDATSLPMEETRSREEVRARLEAKRRKVTTPWGNRPVRTEGLSSTTSTEYVVDETVVERFVTPEFADRPAHEGRTTPPVAKPTATRPRARRAPRTDVAKIVESYLAGRTIPQVAEQFATTPTRVRRILLDTDGLQLRDEREAPMRPPPQPVEPPAPHPEDTPALADLLGRARALVAELDAALSRLTFEGDRS